MGCLKQASHFCLPESCRPSFQTVSTTTGSSGGDEADDDDDAPNKEADATLASFLSFLRRRKSYVLIECKRYDEAEKLLKSMLNDPSSSDYAINELAYLQKIKTK